MKIIHVVGDNIAHGDGEGIAILTNGVGGFGVFSPVPSSRYDGVFCSRKIGEAFRFLESIEHPEPVESIIDHLWCVERRRSSFSESIFMPNGVDGLLYSSSAKVSLKLVLDCKHAYDNRVWGRNYSFKEIPGGVLISYSKCDDSQDSPSPFGEYKQFVAVYSEDCEFFRMDEWIERDYSRDKLRGSHPFNRSVYCPLLVSGRSFAVGFGFSSAQAIASAMRLWTGRADYVDSKSEMAYAVINDAPKVVDDCAIACDRACFGLASLVVDRDSVFAGLPWFFQSWARDSAISCRALSLSGLESVAKSILLSQVSRIKDGVKLSTVLSNNHKSGEGFLCLDGVLWTYLRLEQLMESHPGIFNEKDKALIKDKLSQTISSIESSLVDGLVVNGPKETWMDTEFSGDDRAGARVEMQALALAAMRFAKKLGLKCDGEKRLYRTAKSLMWNGIYLNDGKGDPTIRPNVFIAAYVYPELLSKEEWRSCFDAVLPTLWLDWGGLSTIAKDHHLFTEVYTGESVKSYHRGDSWFWINDMAALVLSRIDRDHYKENIDKIVSASTLELLYLGAAGHHAEVSSASELRSEGCLSQAWSFALFIEMMAELFGKKSL